MHKWFIVLFCLLGLGLNAQASESSSERVWVGFPSPGTQLSFQKTTAGNAETLNWIVIDNTMHNNRHVHRLVGDGALEFYDMQTKSWVMTRMHGDIQEVSPHNGQLDSQIWVGKSWPAEFLYTRRDGSKAQQNRTWQVEARETISVPAGDFDTFRIHSSGDTLSITLWYAPAIKFYVKRVTEGMVQVEQVLLDYHLP